MEFSALFSRGHANGELQVYLAFTYVDAAYGEEGYCGGAIQKTVIPVAPEDVSSVRFQQLTNCTTCHDGPSSWTIQGVYPIRYADFVGPIPLAAYQGQKTCVYGGCETVTEASYSPYLSVPTQLRAAQPIWSQCALFVDGIWGTYREDCVDTGSPHRPHKLTLRADQKALHLSQVFVDISLTDFSH